MFYNMNDISYILFLSFLFLFLNIPPSKLKIVFHQALSIFMMQFCERTKNKIKQTLFSLGDFNSLCFMCAKLNQSCLHLLDARKKLSYLVKCRCDAYLFYLFVFYTFQSETRNYRRFF